MGLGMQLTAWPDDFCQGLASRGFRVIRFDNRDTGLSTKMPAIGPIKATAMLAGATLRLPVRPRYGLADMARDAIGLMDALKISRAHIVGASMGGMIAQIVAADYPERVKSLVSLMSTSGKPTLPGPSPRVLRGLLRRRARRNSERGIAETIAFLRLIGQPWIPDQRRRTSSQGRARAPPVSSSGRLGAASHRRPGGAEPGPGAPAGFAPRHWSCTVRTTRSFASRRVGTPPPTFPARGSGSFPAGGHDLREDAFADARRRNRRPLRGDHAPPPRRLIAGGEAEQGDPPLASAVLACAGWLARSRLSRGSNIRLPAINLRRRSCGQAPPGLLSPRAK